MDINNINRDRDTSGLGPIEYDQSKVPSLIRKYADNVRTKTYGQDVREAQARNAEVAGLVASEAIDISNETKERQDTVETQFNSLQQEITNKDVISAPEIIAARGGEPSLNDRLDKEHQNVTSKLADIAVSPDDFEGTDYEKVQQAVDYATENRLDLRFSRMFDITGHTVLINKVNDRRILRFNGWGGGVVKRDDGYMFSAPAETTYIGDIHSVGMKYEGDVDALEMTVWNAGGLTNGIIRLSLINDTYKSVSHVISEHEDYIQSVRILNCTITGGRGWAIEYRNGFDVSIENNTIEHRQHGIRNTDLSRDPGTTNFRLVNNVIEGLSGMGLEIGSTFGGTISGNYMETNDGGYMAIVPTETAVTQGLVISGNSFLMPTTQVAEGMTAIKIKNMGAGGIVSTGNMSRGALYEIFIPDTNTSGLLHSTGDKTIGSSPLVSGATGRFVDVSRPQKIVKAYRNVTGTDIINAGETVAVIVDFSEDAPWLTRESIISVTASTSSGTSEINVRRYTINDSTKKVGVFVENTGSSGSFYPAITVSAIDVL